MTPLGLADTSVRCHSRPLPALKWPPAGARGDLWTPTVEGLRSPLPRCGAVRMGWNIGRRVCGPPQGPDQVRDPNPQSGSATPTSIHPFLRRRTWTPCHWRMVCPLPQLLPPFPPLPSSRHHPLPLPSAAPHYERGGMWQCGVSRLIALCLQQGARVRLYCNIRARSL